VLPGRLTRTLSAMLANSSSDNLSEPVSIIRAVAGRTAKKNRRSMLTFNELPGCSCLRSERTFARNCHDDREPNDCKRKYLANSSVSVGL